MRESRDSQEPWLSLCPYSPKSLEGRSSKFELPIYGVLRSWPLTRLSGIMLPTVSDEPRARLGRHGGHGAMIMKTVLITGSIALVVVLCVTLLTLFGPNTVASQYV